MSNYDIGRLSSAHRLVVDNVPPQATVLEMGANTGYISLLLREKGCKVVGAEYDRTCLELLATRVDEAMWCDLNDEASLTPLHGRTFDTLVFADVLEHLLDPAAALRACAKLVAENGTVVVSMPNIAHHSIRFDLLRGRAGSVTASEELNEAGHREIRRLRSDVYRNTTNTGVDRRELRKAWRRHNLSKVRQHAEGSNYPRLLAHLAMMAFGRPLDLTFPLLRRRPLLGGPQGGRG